MESWLDYAESNARDVHWHGNDADLIADMQQNAKALKFILKNLPVPVTKFQKN
jgi:hypothetical protein